jgi:uncharacterized Zn finger protein (UPF0148 family)
MKACSICKKEYPLSDFEDKGKVRQMCPACREKFRGYARKYYRKNADTQKARARDWKKENPEKMRASQASYREANKAALRSYEHKRMLRRFYGMTPEDYARMLEEQQGRCPICGSTPDGERNCGRANFAVDHCHETGRVRGLLCNLCNRAMGFFGDSEELLRRAADYLKPADL